MRKTPLVLLTCLSMTTPLWGQQGAESRKAFPGQLSTPASSSVPATKLSERAFFSLAGELVSPGPHELKFEIRVDRRLILQDVLQLPFDAAGGTFELLAGDPEGLARVFALAEKAGRKAQVTVALDGRTLRTFAFPEFLSYNQQFHEAPPTVSQPLGEVRTFASDAAPTARPDAPPSPHTKGYYDPTCLANCDANRDYCYQTEPSCEGVDYCDVCENQWSACRNGCWVCTDPKSVSEYNTSWIKSATWVGSDCLATLYTPNYWWDYYNLVIENSRWRRTEYCDGSHTDTWLYSWDTYGSCMRNTYWSCSYSYGQPWPPYCPF